MKRLTLIAALLICFGLTGCSLMPDPAIGKWSISTNIGGQIDFDLKADGTGAYDPASIDSTRKTIDQKVGAMKALAAPAYAVLDQMKAARITWKKKEKLYELGGLLPGPASSQVFYVKLEDGVASLVNADGSPSKPTGFTLTKKKQ